MSSSTRVRLEEGRAQGENRALPLCIGGACAGPSDECTGPRDYARRLNRRFENWPQAEFFCVGEALARLVAAPQATVQGAIGDIDAFASAVADLKAYDRFNPDHFDRHRVNYQLQTFAQNNRQWQEDDDHYGEVWRNGKYCT